MTDPDDPNFELLLDYLKRSRGFDFTAYKRASLGRRVRKRMQVVGQTGFAEYLDYLEVHPEEFSQLFDTILINVTDFFRDAHAWEVVANEVLPRILTHKVNGEPIRVWSAGCASGQEAYSIAILLAEALGPAEMPQRVKIYATDMDNQALAEARHGSYTPAQVESVPLALREKYFETVNGRCVFNAELRRSVIFGRHDLLQDAPISRVDLLLCRNTLVYFNAEAQSRILNRFDFALRSGGYLFLGKAEVLLTRSAAFTPFNLKYRLFVKVGQRSLAARAATLVDAGACDGQSPEASDTQRRQMQAVEVDPVAQVVLDLNGSLVVVNAQARRLLGLTPEDTGHRLQDLQIYRPVDLRFMIEQVVAERRAMNLKEVKWNLPGQECRYLDVAALPLVNPEDGVTLGVKVIFNDVTRYWRLQAALHSAHQELETTNEELQSTVEELETTNEELQSTVEELETTNEELQSSNEELETMNEELQSTNEEIEATNAELRQSTDELNKLNAFLEAILAGLNDGVAVLDRSLRVLAWNHAAEKQWGLRRDEAHGQHFFALDIGLPVEQLRNLIRLGLDDASTRDANPPLTLAAINRRGIPVEVRVTATPLHGSNNQVQGVILVMEEQAPMDGQVPAGSDPSGDAQRDGGAS